MPGEEELYKFCVGAGCCPVCCLRFLKARGHDYVNISQYLKKRNCDIAPLTDSQVCSTCLGVFQDDLLQEIKEKVAKSEDIKKYDCDKVLVSVSFPLALHVRQLAMWIALINTFSADISDQECPDVPLKEVLKILLIPSICEATGKPFDQNGMMVNVFLEYKDELEEVQIVSKIKPELFEQRHGHKKSKKDFIARNAFERHFIPSKLNLKECNEILTIPPKVPNHRIHLEELTITGPTVFIAGKYRKLSREISQTPWILRGVRMKDESLQDIICDSLVENFGGPEVKNRIIFSSSGREDVDVRCLGSGRPFVLEIPNSLCSVLPDEVATKIEENISKSLKVSVRDLQIVQRDDLKHIKTGEETKRKSYRALCCVVDGSLTQKIIEKINKIEEFLTNQATPIRVLHRRPLLKRPRSIYSVKAQMLQDKPNLFILDLSTQAGTYVKELIHGEFGRTTPSISSLIGIQLDIVSLDVMGIDLDWPPAR